MPEPLNAPPTPFLYSSDPDLVKDCDLQSDFVSGRATWLIGLEDGPLKKLRYDAGQFSISSVGDSEEGKLVLDNTTLKLEPNGSLSMICNSTSETLWTNGITSSINGSILELSLDGKLTIKEKETGNIVWDPTSYLMDRVDLSGLASLSISDKKPFLVLWTENNCVAWASEYLFEKGGLELVVSVSLIYTWQKESYEIE